MSSVVGLEAAQEGHGLAHQRARCFLQLGENPPLSGGIVTSIHGGSAGWEW